MAGRHRILRDVHGIGVARIDEAGCPMSAQVRFQRLAVKRLVVDGQSLAAATLEQLLAIMADDGGCHLVSRIEQEPRELAPVLRARCDEDHKPLSFLP